ncbi:DNA-3-methyladenine glycosylase 2 family protein [Niabella yanshanensis]|uniref:DNA-3-methyladenine glycosylase II n=1 Tax=Niabella yanshanensis TaxID=577386 RepID=A0ABZ0W5V9_9BACT|nr:DNA-3-methyladenine glycosylase 2 family protein [Niabella yanshanensis]WQD38319.1 DNA-3-methyladenine glycosylase 2 family protein [Niabella yanshanensis]
MKALIKEQGVYSIEQKKNVCLQLCASIMSQQLSTKVATVIYNRFLQLFRSKSPKPADILQVPHETLRSIGLSNAKAIYVKNVCHFFLENKLTDARLYKMSNDEIVSLLTRIKGVGQWTVEMLLMFTLARPDVFSTGDLGLQKAIIKLYHIEYANQKELFEKMNDIANSWSPYRTYACRYLWRALDAPLIPV